MKLCTFVAVKLHNTFYFNAIVFDDIKKGIKKGLTRMCKPFYLLYPEGDLNPHSREAKGF
jgi:hypothetical protein